MLINKEIILKFVEYDGTKESMPDEKLLNDDENDILFVIIRKGESHPEPSLYQIEPFNRYIVRTKSYVFSHYMVSSISGVEDCDEFELIPGDSWALFPCQQYGKKEDDE